MIRFDNVSKYYPTPKGRHYTLRDGSFEIARGEALGICGYNGAGKSTLLRMIAGVENPSSGRIMRSMSVSWPIGIASSFQASLTGADNVRFIARIYRRPVAPVLAFVEQFAELGDFLQMPIRTYSSGMMARLSFSISLAVDFDCYLVDEITAVGDERFRQRCEEALRARRDRATLVMVSHDPATLRQYCTRGALLTDGSLTMYETIDEAIDRHFAPPAPAFDHGNDVPTLIPDAFPEQEVVAPATETDAAVTDDPSDTVVDPEVALPPDEPDQKAAGDARA